MFPNLVIFGREISYYTILALIGILAFGFYACKKIKDKGHNDVDMIILLLISSVGVVIGAQLLYGITNTRYIVDLFKNIDKFDSFWEFIKLLIPAFRGSVFYGGLIGGLVVGCIYIKKRKLNFNDFSDVCATGIPLFHTFGRIGCFVGSCCFGIESHFGIVYHHSPINIANDVIRFPVQLLEASLNFTLFLVLNHMLNKGKLRGKLIYVYLIAYAVIRFFDEFLRGDTYRGFIFGLSTSQFISVILFICAVVALYIQKKKARAKI